ncbi:MAG: Gfo/Idh/MocA family oxidoreductase [Candidatus Omnitrophota bacterium]
MKMIFFGLGSIGKRHAEILAASPGHELFAYRSGEKARGNDLGIKEVYSWEDVKKTGADIAFITNPTFLHTDTAIKCAELGMNLFIEKPVAASAEKLALLIDTVDKKGLTAYVAYNLRFHPVIEYLKDHLAAKNVRHVSVYNASYLHGWRRGTDPLRSYSASKEKGGGVILDLSHEFDYIEYLFGKIETMDGVFAKAGDVTLDAEDFLDAVIKTEKTCVNLHLDFMSQHTERSLKIDCADEFIFADLITSRIETHKDGKVAVKKYDSGTSETYKKQLEYFLKNIGNRKIMNNLAEASGLFRKIIAFRNGKK